MKNSAEKRNTIEYKRYSSTSGKILNMEISRVPNVFCCFKFIIQVQCLERRKTTKRYSKCITENL